LLLICDNVLYLELHATETSELKHWLVKLHTTETSELKHWLVELQDQVKNLR
jgi:hypothetical protein